MLPQLRVCLSSQIRRRASQLRLPRHLAQKRSVLDELHRPLPEHGGIVIDTEAVIKEIQTLPFHWGMKSAGNHDAGVAEFADGVESFHNDASWALDGADQSKEWLTKNVSVADPV